MASRQNPAQPPARTLRQLGWLIAGTLALIGQSLSPSPWTLWLQLAGAAIFAVATVRPSALRPVHAGLLYLLRPITPLHAWLANSNSDRRPPRRRRQIADTGV